MARYRAALDEEYRRRFPRSSALDTRREPVLFDGTSHAIRSNRPFMPAARRTDGAYVEDLDGHRMVDYWQGHFANLLGHNPAVVRDALMETLQDGRGLQSGMLHEIETEVALRVCRTAGAETTRFTTAGTLGTFYASVLARAFTGRGHVLKISGGWHGSQPFGLKGVVPHDGRFREVDSEGLAASIPGEVLLTRFNDCERLRRTFERHGDDIACFLLEPVMGAGGGIAATPEFMREARDLTAKHGALLVCDEIITGYRFHPGPMSALYGVQPDLVVLGKILGGGLPVAAVAGRRDVLRLASSEIHRVKFEGGTYSALELSLVAANAMLDHVVEHADAVYADLARKGTAMRARLADVYAEAGIAVHVTGDAPGVAPGSSLVLAHPAREGTDPPACPEDMVDRAHPLIDERLLKSVLILHDVSTRNGLGAISTAHDEDALDRTLDRYRAALAHLRAGGVA